MLIEKPSGLNNSASTNRPLMTLSAYSIQGRRNHMEDFFDIGYQMKPCDQRKANEWPYEYFYFGIFDGHGGSEAAKFAKNNLVKFITKQKDFWSHNDQDVMDAIKKGFAETQSAMKEIMSTWTKAGLLPSTAGTTASVIFIKNGKFYTGHVGDSRILISKENAETKHWISSQLTEDHKPESKLETDRIQQAGGEVRSKIGVHRVVWKRPILPQTIDPINSFLGQSDGDTKCKEPLGDINSYPIPDSLVQSYQTIPFLAIARSLGDFWSINPNNGQYLVSPEPDVSCRPIESDDSSILLATDGLWNVINSSQAVRILQELNILKTGKRQYYEDDYFVTDNFYDVAGFDSENHAQSLVYFAYQIWERRSLRSDNITVVVAMLHDILLNYHHTNKPYATRASFNSSKMDILPKDRTCKLVQLEQTNSFLEKIRLDSDPEFIVPCQKLFEDRWQKLQNYLVLPPTILEQEDNFNCSRLVYPRNYMRLSVATCRKITLDHSSDGESYIYVKQVSDDPADEKEMPSRIGKLGKEVRDASAQATQCIHDFGQPWNQLLDDEIEDDDDDDDLNEEDFDESVQLFFAEEFDENGDFIGMPSSRKDDDADDDDGDEEDDDSKEESDKEKSIPKLRCLLNYTPPPRRATRSSYQSVSENAKRKSQVDISPASKNKRRRSQPVRCGSTRV